MAMLCACSGEQFQLEEAPQSPESLATRDFSVSGLSTRTGGDWESRFDDSQVDDVESTLKETLSLNYEVLLFSFSSLHPMESVFLMLYGACYCRKLGHCWED